MATGVLSNSDIGSILTAQELTRDSYRILSSEIATLIILRINHLLHTSPKSKTFIFQPYFFTDVANNSRLGLQFTVNNEGEGICKEATVECNTLSM